MKLDNHIVNRLLVDDKLWTDMVIDQAAAEGVDLMKPENEERIGNYSGMYHMINNKGNKTYYVTNSVIERLPLFDTKKCMNVEGWKIFSHLPDFKKTFILPDGNKCLRVFKHEGLIYFCHMEFTFHPKENQKIGDDGLLYWILVYVNLDKNEIAGHFYSEDGKRIAPFLYALMCYVLLCDNQTIEIPPKGKHGTQKSGKIINITPFPITVINNTWNVTIVRQGEFNVCGHSAIRWTGVGRAIPKLVFIEPFVKHGYTRRSGKELENQPTQ